MQRNVSGQKWAVFAFDRTDNTPKTGDAANITANLRIDGGAANAVDDTNPTETEGGFYEFDITQAESNGDKIVIVPSSVTSNIQVVGAPTTIYTTPPNFPELGIESDGDVTKANLVDTLSGHTAQTADHTANISTTLGEVRHISGDLIVTSGDVVSIESKVDIIDTEVGLISGDVASILSDTNETQGKLPTNKFMGSSDGADDDGTLNTILDETRHVSGDLLVVSGDVISIKTVTDLLPNAGALNDLATILTEARHISGDLLVVSGDVVSIEGKVDTIDTEVGLISGDVASILIDTGTSIPALIGALNDITSGDVLTQVNAALDTAITELGVAVPTATPTVRTGIMLMYMALRNKLDITATTKEIHNDAGTKIAEKTLSDDTTTYSESEMA